MLISSMNSALADHGGDPNIDFDFDTYNLNSGSNIFDIPVVITVTDSAFAANGGPPDTVPVNISSTVGGSTTLTLTESVGDGGIFVSTNLILMEENHLFQVTDTATITVIDNTAAGNANPAVIDTIPSRINAVSDTDGTGIYVLMTETGVNSGIFRGTLHFSTTSSDDPTDTLQVSLGDIISIVDENSACGITNGLIIPNPFADVGAVLATVGVDAVTATYSSDSASIEIDEPCSPGGGGGGLIRPGLVLDVLAFGGGSARDRSPPQIMADKFSFADLFSSLFGDFIIDPFTVIPAVENYDSPLPLNINGKGFAITQYSNTIETQTFNTGEPVQLQLNLNDQTGVEHIALYMNLRGNEREIHHSDTYIIYEENKETQIFDPHGFFSEVNLTEEENGSQHMLTFNIEFARPMEKSDIVVRAWDPLRNSGDVKIFDAIEVIGEPIVNPGLANSINTETIQMSIPYYKFPEYKLPVADSTGNIIYYNSFGNLEEKQIHPYSEPFNYPYQVGRAERHDNGFQQAIVQEDIKAQTITQAIIGSHFVTLEDGPEHAKFFYPSNVGKLDREKKETLKDVLIKEHVKATKIYNNLYRTNHLED